MKTIKILLLSVAMGFVITSCNVDTKPYESVDVDQVSPDDLIAMTLGSYAYMKIDNGLLRTYHYVAEYGGDNISLSGTTSDPLYFIYSYQRNLNNSRVADLWSYCYRNIVNTNVCIEVGETLDLSDLNASKLLGENYYIRALQYLSLVTIFGQPYPNNPETNLGVPLKLTSDANDYPPRATVKDCYDQIIKDLKRGADLMRIPEGAVGVQRTQNIYTTTEAAWALLSRTYLYMSEHELAGKYADSVIQSGKYSLLTGSDYEVYPTFVPENNKETIFAVRFTKDIDLSDGGTYNIGSMYARIDEKGWGEMYASHPLLMIMERHPQDRRNAFIKKQTLDNGKYWFIYSNNANNYVKVTVAPDTDGTYYVVNENDANDKSNKVLTETFRGGNQYYIMLNGVKQVGRVEEECEVRNNYPKYFVYKCSLQEGQHHMWSPIISRLGEMYLTRAEARYYAGDISGALEDLNVIRQRANIPMWTLGAASTGYVSVGSDDVLSLILEERRVELAFEAVRRFDIFRNKQNLNRNYPGGHTAGNSPRLTIAYDSNDAVEYIPEREIDAYPNKDYLTQNP